jgi:hypothetical protein
LTDLQSTSGGARVPLWANPWWLLVVLLALGETLALAVRVVRVVPEDDWQAAAAAVRERLEDGDAIEAAPGWANPLVRQHLGDRIPLRMAGRSDLAAYERLWVLSARGARTPDAPSRQPDLRERYGRVTVDRFDFGPSAVTLDLVGALPRAKVDFMERGKTRSCRWTARSAGAVRGGLGYGVAPPAQRFVCDPRRKWLWVGATVLEDLDLAPRHCVWQHAAGKQPVGVTYEDVHLGTELVLYGGLYHRHERDLSGAPVKARVLVDGKEIGVLTHADGDGWARASFDTRQGRPADASARGDVRIEVTSPKPHRRSFCWAGSIRDGKRREAP